MDNSNQVTQLLTMVLMFALMILVFLIVILVVVQVRKKMKEKRNADEQQENGENKKEKSKTLEAKVYNKESIFKFMEFDKIQDNMIVQKDGMRYLMVIKCQGVNYDLMSAEEKNGVEQGFQQFLNTLRHPVQLYVQTRTVNLQSSIENYKSKLKEIEGKLRNEQNEYKKMYESGEYSEEELKAKLREVTKQQNMFEYGKDIIENTEKMSKNNNVLNKEYYVIVPYYVEETPSENMDEEEIKGMAFGELYSRAQSIIRTLSICGINSKILNSNEIVELLYVAYNRDESEIFGIDKMIRSKYDELYSTAQDVLDKKIAALNKKIEDDAIELANSKILEVRQEREQERVLREQEEKYDQLVKEMAQLILTENASYVGEDIAEKASDKIQEDKEKEEKSNGKKQQKTKK